MNYLKEKTLCNVISQLCLILLILPDLNELMHMRIRVELVAHFRSNK